MKCVCCEAAEDFVLSEPAREPLAATSQGDLTIREPTRDAFRIIGHRGRIFAMMGA